MSPEAAAATVEPLGESLEHLLAGRAAALADAQAIWRRVRDGARAYRHGTQLFIARHSDVKALLAAPVEAFGKGGTESTSARETLSSLPPVDQSVFRELLDFESLFMSRTTDAERHDRLRRVAHRAFTPRRIDALRATIERYADEFLSPLDGKESFDLAGFAYRFPLAAIADFVGVPQRDHEQLRAWSVKMGESSTREPGPLREGLQAVREFRAYVGRIVDGHRRGSTETSELVAAMLDAEEDERLTTDELAAMIINLVFAGHETTTNLIAGGVTALLRDREQWELLAGDPALAGDATEELLRFVTPVQLMPRVASKRLEAGGEPVEPGQSIQLVLAAANRDPDVFGDPETLDITRTDAKNHLALGFGPRFCLGASLARMEGEIALRNLAQRFPQLAPAEDNVDWCGPAMLRRPARVLVHAQG